LKRGNAVTASHDDRVFVFQEHDLAKLFALIAIYEIKNVAFVLRLHKRL
jgi:hypothetical protein